VPAADGLSEGEAITNIVKAVFGAGVFSLPWAVAQGGVAFVPLFIAAAALVSVYTMSLLVDAKAALLALRPSAAVQLSAYTGIVEEALGPSFGRFAEARLSTLLTPGELSRVS
jgi:amino acid permease